MAWQKESSILLCCQLGRDVDALVQSSCLEIHFVLCSVVSLLGVHSYEEVFVAVLS
jgi:hypothetical protein